MSNDKEYKPVVQPKDEEHKSAKVNVVPTIKVRRNSNEDDDDDDQPAAKFGFFRKAIPLMPRPLAIICCICNILFPGLGTFISAFSVFKCGSHHHDTNMKSFLVNVLAAFLQLVSSLIIVGWIWSIRYGLFFVRLANKKDDSFIEPDLPMFVRRHSSMEAANVLYTSQNKPRLSIALAKVKEEDS